ncbi:hypothetical protein GJR96_16415 [Haloferax sp. MBLA0076]|uniref:Uncharacterized protein n=1 Tax=Haloferax litoreum TaxID=2666140 RepID=A0A6A8GLX4_9EURY|nr:MULTISPECIES: hypothetical protein [Haloferax]KAB1190634.1 hypothetical protein Hfx1148_16360 [Haloferax sp. CBA1148]MRX23532.1 hypothetical protein [Haloferax litoreum]
MSSSGLLVFGDCDRVFDDVPPPYRYAVRQVREHFDRDAFYDAVDDPSAFVFFGVAPCNLGVEYEWGRTPAFLGHGIWNEGSERLLPIEKAEQVFERLGIDPVNTFQKEVNVRDFHPDRYDIPPSAWYDGPAAGVLVENRRGGSAILRNVGVEEAETADPIRDTSSEGVAELVTEPRINRAVERIESLDKAVTTTEVQTRVFEMIVREEYARLDAGNADLDAVRSAIGSIVSEKLGTESWDE